MALKIGSYEVEIVGNCVRSFGDKSAVSLDIRTDEGEGSEVLIFLTEKSMNIARALLKRCDFDVDTRDLEELDANPELLSGKRVVVKVEMYNGKPSPKIDLSGPPPQSEMQRLTAALRAAKNRDNPPDDIPPPSDGDDGIPF